MPCPYHDIKIVQRSKLYPDKPLPHITPMCSAILSVRIWQTPVWI